MADTSPEQIWSRASGPHSGRAASVARAAEKGQTRRQPQRQRARASREGVPTGLSVAIRSRPAPAAGRGRPLVARGDREVRPGRPPQGQGRLGAGGREGGGGVERLRQAQLASRNCPAWRGVAWRGAALLSCPA